MVKAKIKNSQITKAYVGFIDDNSGLGLRLIMDVKGTTGLSVRLPKIADFLRKLEVTRVDALKGMSVRIKIADGGVGGITHIGHFMERKWYDLGS